MDNGHGEDMPDKVKLRANTDPKGNVIWLEVQDIDLSGAAAPATIYSRISEVTPKIKAISRATRASKKFCSVSPGLPRFVYMDVGRWGGMDSREFGIISGPYVALCKFAAGTNDKRIQSLHQANKHSIQIDNLLHSLAAPTSRGIFAAQVVKYEYLVSNARASDDTIYLFIGDLHLPIVNKYPANLKIETTVFTGRGGADFSRSSNKLVGPTEKNEGQVMSGNYDKLNTSSADQIQQWYSRYMGGDIFRGGARDLASDDLLLFIDLLQQSPLRNKVHLIQVGDMYDLWIGLDRYFEKSNQIQLSSGAEEFIDCWIRRANSCYNALTSKLNGLSSVVAEVSFLYGNHDNYLIKHVPAGIPSRKRAYREKGLFCEHGHRVDAFNCDGAIEGHKITNKLFAYGYVGNVGVRPFDPKRRPLYTGASSLNFMANPDFDVYVMAHTHSPYLTKVFLQPATVVTTTRIFTGKGGADFSRVDSEIQDGCRSVE